MSNIPNSTDICGTVVESLAETIQNREKIIIQLREENARLQRNAVAIKDLTERHAHMSNIALGARADVHQTRRDLDKANKERDVARRLYCVLAANGSPATPPAYIAFQWGWDCFPQDNDPTPFLFDQSDSDPRTGVQYGDLN
jgi:hypothetical protein